ncbi:MAG: hypothetical protein AAF439_05030, partial [Pseudomonadota bacterium]
MTRFVLLLFLSILAGAPLVQAGEGVARVFPHSGLERAVWVVDGRADTSSAAPLVVALHGYRNPERAEGLRENPGKLA